jgi:hypothetical protein
VKSATRRRFLDGAVKAAGLMGLSGGLVWSREGDSRDVGSMTMNALTYYWLVRFSTLIY